MRENIIITANGRKLPIDGDDSGKTRTDDSAIAEKLAKENLALRIMLGAGCDANNDGLHTIMGKGRDAFCTLCGEMTPSGKSKAWFSEERLERVLSRMEAKP